jgi:TRAP-type transport system periplasmic protein
MKTRIAFRMTAGSAAALLALTGCSSAGSAGGSATGDGENPPVTISLHHVLSETHPWHACGAVAFEETAEAAGVEIDVEIYPAATTYPDTIAILDAMETGEVDITPAAPSQLATRMSKLGVFDAAYIFEDYDHMTRAFESDVANELFQELADTSGLLQLSTGYYGTRHVTSNIPVHSPADLNGVKMRVIDTPVWLANGRALGATPTPVAFAELYLALQQGVVDSQENPLPVIEAQGFDEVQDYANLTGHSVQVLSNVIRQDLWDSLTPAQQEAVEAASRAMTEGAGTCTLDGEVELLEEWSHPDSTIQINDDVDLDAFRENALEIVVPEFENEWGDLYEQLRAL